MLKVKMPKKIPLPYLPNSDKNTILITKEYLPAGGEETNPDIVFQAALFEEMNHKIAFLRLYDHPLEFIKSQFTFKKAIPSSELCQILILAIEGKASFFLVHRNGEKIQLWLLMTKETGDMPPLHHRLSIDDGKKTNLLQVH